MPFGPRHFTAMANISLSCVSATPTVRTNSDGGGRKEGWIDARFGDLGALSGRCEKPTRKCHFWRVFGEGEGIRLAEKGHIWEITNG